MKKIITRFAPSPTGTIQIGNLRTAIYNWIFARKNNGLFYVRIEDTDLSRSTKEAEDEIFFVLNWMKLDFDQFGPNGILRQSERVPIYKEIAEKMVEDGYAFFCDCVSNYEEKEDFNSKKIRCLCRKKNLKSGVIRFKVPDDRKIQFTDSVCGFLEFSSDEIEDFALLRTDGMPTYMLCVVIDDHLMEVSHVIRGADHITNTFKQILIYEALGYKVPNFSHCPIILDTEKKKLSKRTGTGAVRPYIDMGILPETMFNILLKLGWGFGNEEKITKERALEIFQLNQIRRSPAIFDTHKFFNFNAWYLRNLDKKKELKEFFFKIFNKNLSENQLNILYSEVMQRANTLKEAAEALDFLIEKPEGILKINNKKNIEKFLESLNECCFNEISIEKIINEFSEEDKKNLQSDLRILLTGKKFCPRISKIILALGKEESIVRISHLF